MPGPGTVPDDVVLHWNGASLSAIDGPPELGAALFKVWGSSADDVWIAGEDGTLWRRTAAGWDDQRQEIATFASLLTVHGCGADEVYAVGGQEAHVFDGAAWRPLDEANILSTVNGVSCGADAVLIVGLAGAKLRLDRATGAWIDDTLEEPWGSDFHGAWVSPTGALWAAGGNFVQPASFGPRVGSVAHRGCPHP
jgi:hypothetical protein